MQYRLKLFQQERHLIQQLNDMRNNLQVGDEITTIGGIIGKIVSIKEETIMIETGHDRTKIRLLKSAVRNVDVKAEDAQDWFLSIGVAMQNDFTGHTTTSLGQSVIFPMGRIPRYKW